MKTVQQYFKECDIDEIIDLYNYTHPIELRCLDDWDEDLTVKDAISLRNSKLKELIAKLCEINAIEQDDIWVLFAYHTVEDDIFRGIEFSLVCKSEVLDDNVYTNSYAYELSYLEETAGFYIADTYLTQFYLKDLLVDYLFESSFFGYEQEYIDETLRELEESSEALKSGKAVLTSAKDLYEEFDIPKEEFDEREEAAYQKVQDILLYYHKEAYEVELNKVRNLLKGQE